MAGRLLFSRFTRVTSTMTLSIVVHVVLLEALFPNLLRARRERESHASVLQLEGLRAEEALEEHPGEATLGADADDREIAARPQREAPPRRPKNGPRARRGPEVEARANDPSDDGPPAPLRFDGLVLESGAIGGSRAGGEGAPREPSVTSREGESGAGSPDSAPRRSPPRDVPVGNLRTPPSSPDLSVELARRFPSQARAAGREGDVVVRARVHDDGRLEVLEVLSETDPGWGFSDACRRALAGSRWRAGRDARGQSQPTVITYVCQFRIRN